MSDPMSSGPPSYDKAFFAPLSAENQYYAPECIPGGISAEDLNEWVHYE